MKLHIFPTNKLIGDIEAPGSKSYSHRLFLAACLAKESSIIQNPIDTGDVAVTIESLKILGAKLTKNTKDNCYYVTKGINFKKKKKITIDCKNSGTTVRFLTSLSLIYEGEMELCGEFFKKKRPIKKLLESIKPLGVQYKLLDDSLIIYKKNAKDTSLLNKIKIPGNISSQFISSLLFICPLIDLPQISQIEIEVSFPIVSYPYIQISLEVLNACGIEIREVKTNKNSIRYIIPIKQDYYGIKYKIPGDFSSISFIIAAAVLTSDDSHVNITNLDFQKPQGDKKFIEILTNMGAQIEKDIPSMLLTIAGNVKKYPLVGLDIDVEQTPDLFPILSVVGIFSSGITSLFNALNLRFKESDRIRVIYRELRKMGVKIKEKRDGLIIHNTPDIHGLKIDHENDHRIAMALIVAALFANSVSEIDNVEIIKDSYPNFIRDLLSLGANLKIVN